MRYLTICLTFCILLCVIVSCKKNSEYAPGNLALTNTAEAVFTSKTSNTLAVTTIAGTFNTEGYRDGVGKNALFMSTVGIELANDGSLLVADTRNNKIRKITQEGDVSTLGVPHARDGSRLINPYFVKQANDGTITIFAKQVDLDLKYKFWVWKPGGLTIAVKANKNADYGGWSSDPFNDYYWTCGLEYTAAGFKGFIEQFLPGGRQGVNPYYLAESSLLPADQKFPVVSKIFSAYNGVKYLVVNNTHIYKYTSSGELTRLATPVAFGIIDDIIANKDSRTIYLTSGGRIYGLFNGEVHYLVGPHMPEDGHDGIGNGADVHAFNLALSKDENTLYFTDNRTVRKLILRANR
ncbi:hypothetical protein ABID99_003618 [Mucilaginibacter sp. OAE612]|uniref:hypothetical protein n=1 Tax=Mucilaginibacter sp. OAE612 TaxID=3156444 RepID=UPI00359DF0CF